MIADDESHWPVRAGRSHAAHEPVYGEAAVVADRKVLLAVLDLGSGAVGANPDDAVPVDSKWEMPERINW